MHIRRLCTIALAGLAFAATGLIAPAGAQADGVCLDWRDKGLPRDYCKITPEKAHVYTEFTNNSDRTLRVWIFGGDNLDWERDIVVAPGRTANLWGASNGGVDLVAFVSWCPKTTYSADCEGKLQAQLSWKNPFIGWPWMRVDQNQHGFRALERHTFESAYGTGGIKGVAKFKAQRLTDKASGTKRYQVGFTFATPVNR